MFFLHVLKQDNFFFRDEKETKSLKNETEEDNARDYIDWMKKKAELKYNKQIIKNFYILNNYIYWCELGINIGSEQDKHRPVIVGRTSKNSPICMIITLTSAKLKDNYDMHVDLECMNSTAILEQIRIVDKKRIDKPYRKKGKIIKLQQNDIDKINQQIMKLYLLKPIHKE